MSAQSDILQLSLIHMGDRIGLGTVTLGKISIIVSSYIKPHSFRVGALKLYATVEVSESCLYICSCLKASLHQCVSVLTFSLFCQNPPSVKNSKRKKLQLDLFLYLFFFFYRQWKVKKKRSVKAAIIVGVYRCDFYDLYRHGKMNCLCIEAVGFSSSLLSPCSYF